jgi:thiol-disulfide isomerase/thioredoxin
MIQVINHYSAVFVAAVLLLVAAVFLLRRKARWQDALALGLIAAGLLTAWIILHPVQTPLMEDAQKVQAMIGQGKPVLLEFQSPYCLGCTRAKPIVDALEQELTGQLLVIRLNIQESVGRALAPIYMFEYTPTFILFDAQGNELWRQVGSLDVQRVRDSIK